MGPQKMVPIHKRGSWLFFLGGVEAFEKGDPPCGLVCVFLKNGGSFLKLQSHEMNKYMRIIEYRYPMILDYKILIIPFPRLQGNHRMSWPFPRPSCFCNEATALAFFLIFHFRHVSGSIPLPRARKQESVDLHNRHWTPQNLDRWWRCYKRQ